MPAPLPLLKLGALLAKQIAKPLAKVLKEKANHSEFLKTRIVMPPAQYIRVRMKLLGLGSPDKVPPLTEKAAIELGADVLSELFVFGSAVAAIIIEYVRQNRNKNIKATAFEQKVEDLGVKNTQIFVDVENHMKLITSMKQLLVEQSDNITNLNKKLDVLDERIGKQQVTSSTQTSPNERPTGKIIYASNKHKLKVSADPSNSLVYQSADDAIFIMTRSLI